MPTGLFDDIVGAKPTSKTGLFDDIVSPTKGEEEVKGETVSPEEMADVEHKATLFALQKKARLAANYWEGVERRAGELMPLAEKEQNPLTAALNSASQLVDTTLKAVGILPKEAPPPAQIPTTIVSPEAATEAVRFMSPARKASEGSRGQAVEEFVGQNLAGLTGLDPALQLASGKYLAGAGPVVAKSFGGQMAAAIPQSVEQLSEASGAKETTKAALETGLIVGGPMLIGKSLVRPSAPVRPGITGKELAMPPRVEPPTIEQSAAAVGPATAEAVKATGLETTKTEATDAIQKRSTEEVHVQPTPADRQAVEEGVRSTAQPAGIQEQALQGGVNAPELAGGTQGTPRDNVSTPAPVDPSGQWQPAIRLAPEKPGDPGKVITGEPGQTHPDIIQANNIKAESIDQRGFVDPQGNWKTREETAQQMGGPTDVQAGRKHSTDLPEAKGEAQPKWDNQPFDENQWHVTVQSPTQLPDKTIPGFVQMDRVVEGVNTHSTNPETMRKAGINVPSSQELQQLPQGRYTLAQAKEQLAKTGADQVAAGAGPGSPHISEVPPATGGEDVLGVRQETREKQAAAGLPVEATPGKGRNVFDAIANGRALLAKDPTLADRAMATFRESESKGNARLSENDFDVARAKYDEVFRQGRRIEELHGTDSPEYRAAREEIYKWSKLTKDMGTVWNRMGTGQQGEVDIDFGHVIDLENEYKLQTGKDFTPKQKKTAEGKAAKVKKAEAEQAEAKSNLVKHIKETKDVTDAEQAALDAASKTVRDWAARLAELENEKRAADAKRDTDVAEIQRKAEEKAKAGADRAVVEAARKSAQAESKERVRRAKSDKEAAEISRQAEEKAIAAANQAVRDAARKAARQETKDRIAQAKREKELAELKIKEEKKRHDAAMKFVRQNAIKIARMSAKERELKADVPTYAWTKAREYIEQGMDDFDEIRHKIATDMGLPVEQITAALAKDKRAKFLADEVWRKQQLERQLKNQTKQWLNDTTVPGYIRAIQSVPRILFSLKVGFHGTVALGTHAPMVAFQPTFWKTYAQDFAKMYRMVGAPTAKGQAAGMAYYEMQVQDLMRRKNYITARRAGLVNDPFVYEDYNSPDTTKYFGRMTTMGNRGYTVLKILRQDMFDQMWDKLPRTAQIPEMAEAIADGLNHSTGVVKGRSPMGTNLMLFAPRLEASRVMWLAGDPIRAARTFIEWKHATKAEKAFAMNQVKEKLWVSGTFFSLLALNQGFLAATGSDQKINGIPESLGGAGVNPLRSDFMKFKAAGMNISYGNAMLAMAKLPLSLWVGVANEGKFNKIKFEDENVATIAFRYARSQASPFMGLMFDLAFGRDFEQRPLPRAGFGVMEGKRTIPKRLKAQGVEEYSWPEFWSERLAPIPFQEALKEVWGGGLGMNREQIEHFAKALTTIVVMAGTGGRITEDYEQVPVIPQPVRK